MRNLALTLEAMKLDTSSVERESFYDNQSKQNEAIIQSEIKLEPVNFRTEKSININHGPSDKDEFDDLIRLTHRATKQDKLVKSQSQFDHNNEKNSSLPPLPPLPYSFVKLETNQKPKLTSSTSTLILKNGKQRAKGSEEETKCTKQPATTRLIIPINTAHEKKNDSLDFFLISSTRNNNGSKNSTPTEIDVEIYHNNSKNKVKEKPQSSCSSSSEIETDSNSCSSSSEAHNVSSSLGDEWEQVI